jgi:hypothetical protein
VAKGRKPNLQGRRFLNKEAYTMPAKKKAAKKAPKKKKK